jgi:hypothetical protein
VSVGDILVVTTTLTNPPKTKIAIDVGNGHCLWFNTDPRRNRIATQLRVQAGEAPGITRDCYLDCGEVKSHPAAELAAATNRGPASKAFLAKVSAQVLTAKTLTPAQRSEIVKAL